MVGWLRLVRAGSSWLGWVKLVGCGLKLVKGRFKLVGRLKLVRQVQVGLVR